LKIERRISGAAFAPLSFFRACARRKNAFRSPSVREVFAFPLPGTAFLPPKMLLQTMQKICF
jgi:hypothetical protein